MKNIVFIFGLVFLSLISNAQTTKTIGATGADYITLKSAFDAVNSGALTGALEFQIIDNTTETASAVLNASGSGGANYTSIHIYPVVSGLTIGGSLNSTMITLNGADNVSIDGSVNAADDNINLLIYNSNTGTSASTIQLTGGACNNVIKYCSIQGASSGTSSVGIIRLYAYTANNENNLITRNNISGYSTYRPYYGINFNHSSSLANNSNIVSYNSFYNMFGTAGSYYVIMANSLGVSNQIVYNDFFEPDDIIATSSVFYNFIYVSLMNSTLISGNNMGGKSAGCVGSMFSINGGAYTSKLNAIINGGGTDELPTSIQANRISNFYLVLNNTSASHYHYTYASDALFVGIKLSGSSNLGTISGNTIGNESVTDNITIVNNNASYRRYSLGVYIEASNKAVTIQNNIISGLKIDGVSTTSPRGFAGIVDYSNSSILHEISNNTIGSSTLSNSIGITSNTASQEQYLIGIYTNNKVYSKILDNTIANLNNPGQNYSVRNPTIGIYTSTLSTPAVGSCVIEGNTVCKLHSNDNYQYAAASSPSLAGIYTYEYYGLNVSSISDNSIYELISDNTTSYKSAVVGIYFNSKNNGYYLEVSKNLIRNLVVNSSNLSSTIHGIYLYPYDNAGLYAVKNNLISLGKDIVNGYNIYNVYDASNYNSSTSNNVFYHNTLHIEGEVSNGGNTYNLFLQSYSSSSVSNYRKVKNNLFINSRSSIAGTAKHYGICISYTPYTEMDYNNYRITGINGYLGAYNSIDKLTLPILGIEDAHSLTIDPQCPFNDRDEIADFEPQVILQGIDISGIETDINGASRVVPFIGAVEKALSTVDGSISANQAYCVATTPTDISISGQTYTSIQWQSSNDNITFSDMVGETDSILTGASIGLLTQTMYYRAKIIQGTYIENYSDVITVYIGLTVISNNYGQSILVNTPLDTLSVAAVGLNPTYQWYSNTVASNSGGVLLSSETNSYFLPGNSSVSNLYYYCEITNSCGTVTSDVSGRICINQKPTITSFTPTREEVGNTVTITGSNFGSTIADNIVYINQVKASITSANSTELQVTVPYGSHLGKIKVINCESNLSVESESFFYQEATELNICAVKLEKGNLNTSPISDYYGVDVKAVDLNNDGKLDVCFNEGTYYANNANKFGVFMNTSSTGGNIAFSALQQISVNYVTQAIDVNDFNGDGKMDVAIIGRDYNQLNTPKLIIFVNTTPQGNASATFTAYEFDIRNDNITSLYFNKLEIADMDNDGKEDVVFDMRPNVATYISYIYVMRNQCSSENINFEEPIAIPMAAGFRTFTLADLNQDDYPEIIYNHNTTNTSVNFRVMQSTSSPGTISYNPYFEITTNARWYGIAYCADFDKDGKVDIVVNSGNPTGNYFIKNNNAGGALSSSDFSADLYMSYYVGGSCFADMNNDGNVDFLSNVYSNESQYYIHLGNGTSSGTVVSQITTPYIDTDARADRLTAADFNNDGKTDMIGKTNTYGPGMVYYQNNSYPAETYAELTQQPSTTIAGTGTFAQQPIVQLKNGDGTNLAVSGVSIAASIYTGYGTLSGTTTRSTNASGIATFTDLGLSCGLGDDIVLKFSTSDCAGFVLSDTIRITRVDMAGIIQVGSSKAAPFNSLINAFNAFAYADLSGPVTFELIDEDYNLGSSVATLYKNLQSSSVNTLTMKAASGVTPTITSSSSFGVIRMNGADYVTIDGANSSQENAITLINTNAAPIGIRIDSLTTGCITTGSNNITIKNLNIKGNSNTSGYGVYLYGYGINELTIENNSISKFGYGIYHSANTNVSNNIYADNTIGSDVVTDYVGISGICLSTVYNCTISGNTIKNIKSTTTSNYGPTGIALTSCKHVVVSDNFINGIEYNGSSYYSGKGLYLYSSDSIDVYNNIIANIGGKGYNSTSYLSYMISGIYNNASNSNFYFNTISLNGNFNGYYSSNFCAAIINAANNCNFKNNILVNNIQSATYPTAKSYAFYSNVTGSNIGNIDYNTYFGSGSNFVLGYVSGDKTSLATLQAATSDDAHSVISNPLFLNSGSLNANDYFSLAATTGIAVSGVSKDFNGINRFSPPHIGALNSQINYWISTSSTNFNNTSNWSTGIVPVSNSAIYIDPSATADIVIPSSLQLSYIDFNNANHIKIDLDAYDLNVNEIANSDANNYVKTSGAGKLSLSISNTSSALFPVGSSTYSPVTITNNTGASDQFQVRVFDDVLTSGTNGISVNGNYINRTWDISNTTQSTGSGTVDFDFNYAYATNFDGAKSLYHYNSNESDWELQSSGLTSGVDGINLTYTGYSGTFSPFALRDAGTLLPIQLISLSAEKVSKNVLVSWQTSSELYNDYYIVQRSFDGVYFENIKVVDGAGISNSQQNYKCLDEHVSDKIGVVYYRLEQHDFDGEIEKSHMVSVLLSKDFNFTLYPNPADAFVIINTSEDQMVKIYSELGKVLKTISLSVGENRIDIKEIPDGVYFVKSESQVLKLTVY